MVFGLLIVMAWLQAADFANWSQSGSVIALPLSTELPQPQEDQQGSADDTEDTRATCPTKLCHVPTRSKG